MDERTVLLIEANLLKIILSSSYSCRSTFARSKLEYSPAAARSLMRSPMGFLNSVFSFSWSLPSCGVRTKLPL